jgi:hypothetical protein
MFIRLVTLEVLSNASYEATASIFRIEMSEETKRRAYRGSAERSTRETAGLGRGQRHPAENIGLEAESLKRAPGGIRQGDTVKKYKRGGPCQRTCPDSLFSTDRYGLFTSLYSDWPILLFLEPITLF